MTRKKERECIFSLIFAHLISENEVEKVIKNIKQTELVELNDYSCDRAIEVVKNRENLDKAIEKYLKGWKIGRITKASQAILELAMYEILYDETIEAPVSINEAVELAKKYSKEEDPSFVNGVLSSFIKDN